MAIIVEDCEAVNELPYLVVVGMKYVWPVAVDVDPLSPLCVAVSADILAAVDK